VCGCTPAVNPCAYVDCGYTSNGCGGSVYCGTCGGGGCFVAGSLVAMADGSTRSIEQVKVGDRVKSLDRVTGALRAATVTSTQQHGPESSADGIVVVNGRLHATRNHPILAGGRVVRMDQLRVGDAITHLRDEAITAGAFARATSVKTLTIEPGGVPTYNIRLDGASDTYFVDTVNIIPK